MCEIYDVLKEHEEEFEEFLNDSFNKLLQEANEDQEKSLLEQRGEPSVELLKEISSYIQETILQEWFRGWPAHIMDTVLLNVMHTVTIAMSIRTLEHLNEDHGMDIAILKTQGLHGLN